MISPGEQKAIEKMINAWQKFKRFRNRKKFDFNCGEGWLTMIDREQYLDFAIEMLGKCKKEVFIYE
jgi:hypothetical protein